MGKSQSKSVEVWARHRVEAGVVGIRECALLGRLKKQPEPKLVGARRLGQGVRFYSKENRLSTGG